MQRRILLSIGILSISLIAFQLILMQILSIVQWYHFAYMIISVALLGFGAGGTFLAVFRKWCMKHFHTLLPVLMIFTGLAMAVAVKLSQSDALRFDSMLLFTGSAHAGRLVVTYLVFFIPFFTGALSIGLVFVKMVSNIGHLYFSNLVGSGLGGLLAIMLMWWFMPQYLPPITALFAVLAGIIVLPVKARPALLILALFSLATLFYYLNKPPKLVLSEYKSLSRTMDLPDAEILLSRSSPMGLIQLATTPALRYAPGLSLIYASVPPVKQAVFENGNWFGPIIPRATGDSLFMMNFTTNALPYVLGQREHVLVLNSGTGVDVAHALAQKANTVTAVESNVVAVSMLKGELAQESDSLYFDERVDLQKITPRTYLMSRTDRYDLINLPMVGTFGGSSGLNALQEHYLFTVESLGEMWNQLTPDGVISISCWMDYPYRYPLKTLATLVEMMASRDIIDPAPYLATVRSWGTITFVVKKSPLNSEEIQKTREFCEAMYFDPAILPDLRPNERSHYNTLQDELFFDYLDRIISHEREAFYDRYAFNVRPATDNRPYFSQFLKWQSLSRLSELFGTQSMAFFEIGYFIVIITLIQIAIIAVVLIILPLFRLGWQGTEKVRTIFYFGGLGLGYMYVEIILIQRFILYFGDPIYSAAAVISFMLICSGVGSYFSSMLKAVRHTFILVLGVIIVILAVHALFLTSALQTTVSWPLAGKLFMAFLLISLPAFLMGMPFPLGLRFLSKRNEEAVPWAWGINGCLSVISSGLALIVSVEFGFASVMIMATVAYAFPLVAHIGK